MKSDQKHSGYRRFFVKQTILLLITVILMVLFTFPLLRIVKSAMNPEALTVKVEMANNQAEGIQNEVDAVRSKMLMGAGDEEAQEKLKNKVEELQRQMAFKELEYKLLQNQYAMVNTLQQIVNSKPPPPVVDFWQKLAELAFKIIGCIGSMFSGGMFLVSWWRARRKPPEYATS
jgi:hypothetical protein